MIRAKFRCVSVADTVAGGEVNLEPVYDGSPENAQFYQATPAGAISLRVTRPETLRQFVVGQPYYVDFSPAPD